MASMSPTPDSLAALISSHHDSLSKLFTSLTPTPTPLLSAKLDQLHLALSSQIASQLTEVQSLVSAAESRVAAGWQKVTDWKAALGETVGSVRGDGPLEIQAAEVEAVLSGMRSRMEERGKAIVQLQKRLAGLVEMLGKEFLKVEMEDWEKGWEALDLRLERMSNLERELLRCDAEVARRRTIINANVNEIFQLRTELGIHQDTHSPPSSTHPSESANAPISDPFDEAILCHLGVGDARQQTDLAPTNENLQRVEAKRKWLEEEKDHRNELIQKTYDKLYPLWGMLGVSDAEMDEFVNRWMGSTPDVVNAYQSELTRMLTLKRSNLSRFIAVEREALTALWDALYLSPQQRLATFPPFAISVEPTRVWNAVHGVEEEIVSENVSEELLVAHERERERVEVEVERTRPILERLSKYFEVVEEMRELEASASDPSRLLGKSTRGDPGRLLREEKARKRVVIQKPKLETELRQIIPLWEQENNRPFLINGRRFIDTLDQRMEAEAAEKESKKRKPLAASSSSSSASSSRSTAPLRAQKTGTNSSSSTPAPIKRHMTGGSSVSSSSSSQHPPKRQIPMRTGDRPPSSLGQRPTLGEIGNSHPPQSAAKLSAQNTGRGYGLGASTPSSGVRGGMKIPAGWGGSETPTASTNTTEALGQQGQLGGSGVEAFRPRSSTQSSASGASSGVASWGRSVNGGF
ncbi:Ase1/PRC1/MAP65 family protein, partial [Phenoliferia sp. Uapishka_3]